MGLDCRLHSIDDDLRGYWIRFGGLNQVDPALPVQHQPCTAIQVRASIALAAASPQVLQYPPRVLHVRTLRVE